MRENPAIKGWVSANDIEDTKHLNDEIRRLKVENDRLEKLVAAAPKAASSSSAVITQSISEVIDILEKTPVEIPAHLSSSGPRTSTLFNMFVAHKDTLINGVTNSGTASAVETFFYSNVMPKLIVHGLAEIEKVSGVRFRRSFINGRGVAILAEIEKRSARPVAIQATQSAQKPKTQTSSKRAKKSLSTNSGETKTNK